MYIKRVELSGFKSFCSRTSLSLEPGLSCVVGPNGSGKSNIADAIRWVLGETSARSIRGGRMEDVIFAGTAKRRPLGLAEVSLIIDNSDSALALPFTEVSVSRRAGRGGLSEYFINGQPCRLKDIRDLFMDTGLGADGLSLIDQGRVHQLISARPEERRAVVEEAAGIVKYRERKREAQRKLEETRRHLERVGDIIHELDLRLGPLAEEDKIARRYLELKAESDQAEIGLSVRVLSEAGERMAELDGKLADKEAALLALETQRLTIAAEGESLRAAIAALGQEVAAENEAFYRLQTEREREEGQLKLAETQLEASVKAAARWREELDQAEQALIQCRQEEEALSAHILRTEREIAEAQDQVQAGESSGLGLDVAELSAEAEALKNDLSQVASRRAAAEAGRELRRHSLEQISEELDQAMAQAEAFESEAAALEEEGRLAEEKAAKLAAENKELTHKLRGIEQEQMRYAQSVQDLAAAEADCRFRCHSQQTRLHMLEEVAQGFEGFFPGVKGAMQGAHQGQLALKGVVAQLLEVAPEYRVAIEAYLGANLQNIITDTADQAKAAVAYLKKHQLGRATFLPLDSIQPREAADISPVVDSPGVRGRASDLVRCEPSLTKAVDFLLNNVVITENLDQALLAAKKLRFKVSVVSLEGDLVAPGAAISGGSRNKKAGELLGQRAKLVQAQQELEKLQSELAQCDRDLQAGREEGRRLDEAADAVRQEMSRVSGELEAVERQVQQDDIRCQALAQQADSQKVQARRFREQQAIAQDELAEEERNLLQHQEDEERLTNRLEQVQSSLGQARTQVQAEQDSLTQLRLALAQGQEKLKGQTISLERIRSQAVDLSWEAEAKGADLAQAEREQEQYQQQAAQSRQALMELADSLRQAGDKLDLARHGLGAESATLAELEREEKRLLKDKEALTGDSHQLQLRRERWQADYENEAAKLAETFQLDLAQAREQAGDVPARTTLLSRVSQLKREIAALGQVNLTAIQEYQEVSERWTFLTTQREDLLVAGEKLNQVISEMDEIMIDRFRQAFSQLSLAFDASFRRLFDGGSASLVLSQPEDILETGVELRVEPPGKKVANYNLLSGGEKALIGMALIFALLTVRPTPFCLMDEVDAALDEANIDRFTSYLQEKAGATQFLLISHRQTTMEAASVLWGVTMEEEGVSKVISVRLSEAVGA